MRLISKNIKLLEGPQFKYPYCHCLLIEDDRTCLIDSSPFEAEKEYLKGKDPDIILNTHGHQDHCLINPDYPGAEVHMHMDEHAIAASGEAYLQEFGFYSDYASELMRTHFLTAINYRPRPADAALENGALIDLGLNQVRTIYLPGHSAGHCGFILPRPGVVFTGDIDLGTFPWYGNVRSSIGDFLSSIQLLADMGPDAIITGHGEGLVTRNIALKLKKYRDIILFRELEILKLLAAGKDTIDKIARRLIIYRKLPPPEALFYMYECTMVLKHLEHLQELGKVVAEGGKYYLKDGVKTSDINII